MADIGPDDGAAAQQGRRFYTMLQDIQDLPLRGMGLLSQEEIDAILKFQKKENDTATAHIQNRESNVLSAGARGYSSGPSMHGRPTVRVG